MKSTQGNPDTPRGVLSELPCTPDKLGDSLQSNSAYCRQVYINSSALTREPNTPTPPDDDESQVSTCMRRAVQRPCSWVQVSFSIAERTPAERTIATRQTILATLPLPSGIPDDALQPIMIHPPHTLHEFLGNVSGVGLFQVSFAMLTPSSLSRTCEDYFDVTTHNSISNLSRNQLTIGQTQKLQGLVSDDDVLVSRQGRTRLFPYPSLQVQHKSPCHDSTSLVHC